MSVRIAHVALWASTPERLEAVRAFYETHFGARSGALYRSARQPGFVSYFLRFDENAACLELMYAPAAGAAPGDAVGPRAPRPGYAHLALAVGSRDAVDDRAARLSAAGVPLVSPPRLTGDGYYEAVVLDPDGNVVEITA